MHNGPYCNCSEGYTGKNCDKPTCQEYDKCLNGINKLIIQVYVEKMIQTYFATVKMAGKVNFVKLLLVIHIKNV